MSQLFYGENISLGKNFLLFFQKILASGEGFTHS
jgi:hypothetical protein